MDNGELILGKEDEQMDLPPGFRFHPTDEELITHYLCNKVIDSSFSARAIGDIDLNKCEPWDLPWRAKMGEKEWYFFCVRDRKYPTGLRTNRATEAGYWKATGKDKEIYRGAKLVGMKKTLVFYRGRAPKGEKSNWVMHEYRLEGKPFNYNLTKSTKNEWVICRIFNKSSSGKKIFMGHQEMNSSLNLPPLMDLPFTNKNRVPSGSDMAHVTCFSNAMESQKGQDELLAEYYNPPILSSSNVNPANPSEVLPSSLILGKMSLATPMYGDGFGNGNGNFQATRFMQLLESNGFGIKQSYSVSQDTGLTSDMNAEISSVGKNTFEAGDEAAASGGALQLQDCLWHY